MPIIESERYDIEPKPIGRGGFGEVYRAYDHLFRRQVVIKTIVASQLYGINEPDLRRQFFKEAVISARLGTETPYIVQVLDYGYDRTTDLPFFVMEFIEGHDLTREVGAFSLEQAVLLLSNMLAALRVAHDRGVVHSDISPDNILYSERERLYKLNDFGLARLLNSNLMSRGSARSLVGGKPGYLPLLDWQTGARTAHSDLYGLAVTVAHLITGRIPTWTFSKGTASPPDVLSAFERKFGTTLEGIVVTLTEKNAPEDFLFWAPPPSGGLWHLDRERTGRQGFQVAAQDVAQLISLILSHQIVTLEAAVAFLKDRSLERLRGLDHLYGSMKKASSNPATTMLERIARGTAAVESSSQVGTGAMDEPAGSR
jgi:serine/threonine protein kinase